MRKLLASLTLSVLLPGLAHAAVVGKPVDYSADGVTLKGYLAYDDAKTGKRPGVLVVHEWWGHNAYARKRAEMLAEMGYVALAVDMYGDGKQAEHPKEAGEFMNEVMKNMDTAKARFTAAEDFLKQQDMTDADKLAAIGYCFGGGTVLNMARAGLDLKGVASFHGGLAAKAPAQAGAVKAKILVLNGEADPMAPPEMVKAFKDEMDAAKVDYKFINYPGVKHSFTNPDADELAKKFDLPLAYDAEADKASWAELEKFLDGIFME